MKLGGQVPDKYSPEDVRGVLLCCEPPLKKTAPLNRSGPDLGFLPYSMRLVPNEWRQFDWDLNEPEEVKQEIRLKPGELRGGRSRYSKIYFFNTYI